MQEATLPGLPYATQSSAGHQHASIMSRLEILYFQVQRSRGKVPGACIPWSTYQGDVAIRFSSARPKISHGLGIYVQTRVPPEYSVLCRRIAWLEVVSYIDTHMVRWVGLGLGTQDWRMIIPSLRHSRENGFAGWVEGLVNRCDDLVQHTSASAHHYHQQQQLQDHHYHQKQVQHISTSTHQQQLHRLRATLRFTDCVYFIVGE